MRLPHSWTNTVKLPAVNKKQTQQNWSLPQLEAELLNASRVCAEYVATQNRGRVATCLSGGLDSSLNLAMVRVQFPTTVINAFTIGGSARHPDVIVASEVAKQLKAFHYIFIPQSTDIERAKKVLKDLFQKPPNQKAIIMFCLYKYMAENNVSAVLSHHGLNELMGGYREHQCQINEKQKLEIFERLWRELPERHLKPLERIAKYWDISICFPYLQPLVVKYAALIPLADRTSEQENKIPIRRITKKYNLPQIVLRRSKKYFCDALDINGEEIDNK